MDQKLAAARADELIASEIAVQDKMWGEGNERADAKAGQMLKAATAQVVFVGLREKDNNEEEALVISKRAFYPRDWDGFRSYGSHVANLVVAAAYLRQEIKRRLANGEAHHRTSRGEAYDWKNGTPAMTSTKAIAELKS